MIDIYHDELIPIRQVPKYLPRPTPGKKTHITTVYRWVNGIRGVRLESVKIGGARYTSREAIKNFIRELTAKSASQAGQEPHTDSYPQSRSIVEILGERRGEGPGGGAK